MSTTFHTAIASGAAANASTFNTPLGALDAALSDILNADLTMKDNAVDRAAVLASNVVETAKIKDANVTLAKLEAVTSGQIIVGSVANRPTAVALSGDATLSNAGALTIANDAITAAKIAANAVGASEIATGAVGADELASDAVTTAKILDANVTLAKLASDATALIASSISNLVWDEINLHVEDKGNWNGLPWWEDSASLTIVDDGSNPYGGKTLRSTTSAKGKGIYLSDVGLVPGDVISAGLMCKAASGTYNLRLIFRTTGPGASAVGGTINGSAHAFSGDTFALTVSNVTIPATANWVSIVPYSASPTSIDMYAMWLHRGTVAAVEPTPSPFTATYLRLKEWETSRQRLMIRNVDTTTFHIYQPMDDGETYLRWIFKKFVVPTTATTTNNWTYYGAEICSDNAGTAAYGVLIGDIGYAINYTPNGATNETCGNHHLNDNYTAVNFYNAAGLVVDPTAAGAAFQVKKLRIEQKGTLRHPDTGTTDHATISRITEFSVDGVYEHMRLSWLTANNLVGYWNTGQLLASSATYAWIKNYGDVPFTTSDSTWTIASKQTAYTWYASRKFAFEVYCPTAEAIQLRQTTLKVYPRTIDTDVTRGIGDVDHGEWYWKVIYDKEFLQRI